MNYRKKWTLFSLLLSLCIVASAETKSENFSLTQNDKEIKVFSGGAEFIIPSKGEILQIPGVKKIEKPIANVLLVSDGSRQFYVLPDGRDNHFTVLENGEVKKVIRADLSLTETVAGKKVKEIDSARLIVYYQFVQGIPGVVITERIKALKPISLHKFNIVIAMRFGSCAVDSLELKPYPAPDKQKGGTKSNEYVLGETVDGQKYYFSNDAKVFVNSSFFVPFRCHLHSTNGLGIPVGKAEENSLVIGRVFRPENVGQLNSLRSAAGKIPEESAAVSSETGPKMEGQMFATELKKDAHGDLKDWSGIPVIVYRGETKDYRPKAGLNWNGPKDLSFTFKAAYDSEYLYLKIDVNDDHIVNKFEKGSIWLGDSIQFGIDPLCEKNGNHYISFGISAADKPGIWCYAHPNKQLLGDMAALVKNKSKVRKGGIEYELAIPWNFFKPFEPIRGKMGFNFTVIDQDTGTNYENWMGITDGVFAGVNQALYYDLNLKSVESVMLATQKTPDPKSVFPYAVIMSSDKIAFTSFVVITDKKTLPAELTVSFNGQEKFTEPLKTGFNSFSFQLPEGTLAPGKYKVETAVRKNGDVKYLSAQNIAVLSADYLNELNRKLTAKTTELDSKLAELKKNGKKATDIIVLTEMIRHFVNFIRLDVNADQVMPSHTGYVKVDSVRRRYIFDRAFDNLNYCLALSDKLLKQADAILTGKEKAFSLPDFVRGVQPVIQDGGFKVNGRELMLFGPQTWTNVRGFNDEHFPIIAKTGLNFVNNFYVGGARRDKLVKYAEDNNLYFSYGASTATILNAETIKTPYYMGRVNNPNHYLSPLKYFSPNMVFSIGQGEQFPRKYEMTPEWAAEFQAYLKQKFGSIMKLNSALSTSFKDFSEINYSICLQNPALKYESFVYRLSVTLPQQKGDTDFKREYFKRPVSTHYSTHYNIAGLDPLVVLCDFEGIWGLFDVIGFDGGVGMDGSAYALDFSKGMIECDMARSFYPEKPIANNEAHIFNEASYDRYTYDQTYMSHLIAFLHGQNACSIWVWRSTFHTQGEYAFTRADTYHPVIWVSLHLQKYAEEIAAFRKQADPPFRILHSLPSMTDRDTYVKSLYSVYEGCYFTGWPVRFLSERMLAKNDFKGAKIVVVPEAKRVSATTFDALVKFVEIGGKVLVFGRDALTCDEYGKIVPSREALLDKFIRKPTSGPIEYDRELNALLAQMKLAPLVHITNTDGRIPFGVEYRTAKGKDGKMLLYILNLNRTPVTVNVPGKWYDLIEKKDFPATVTLKSLEFHLLKQK